MAISSFRRSRPYLGVGQQARRVEALALVAPQPHRHRTARGGLRRQRRRAQVELHGDEGQTRRNLHLLAARVVDARGEAEGEA